jgi:hypothetical protein
VRQVPGPLGPGLLGQPEQRMIRHYWAAGALAARMPYSR